MNNIKVKAGDVYNAYTVLCRSSRRSSGQLCYQTCVCVCGTVKDVQTSALTRGTTKSCGCMRASYWKSNTKNIFTDGTPSYGGLYSVCRRVAKDRNIPFNLSREEHRTIISGFCFYCGAAPKPYNYYIKADGVTPRQCRKSLSFDTDRHWIHVNTVDRVDSSLGYYVENCVAACYKCNIAKNRFSEFDFISHAYRIVAHQESLKKKAS